MRKLAFLVLSMVMVLISCNNAEILPNPDQIAITENSTIVCFGDSLTRGYGALVEEAYPSVLSNYVNIPVVNSGFNAYTTDDAIGIIQSAVLDYDPAIVIIEFGANDYFQNSTTLDINTVKMNMEYIINEIQDENRIIYLAKFYTYEMALDVLSDMKYYDDFENMFESLKNEYNVRIINDIWTGIWGDSSLMFDSEHPNADGYYIMAQKYYNAIESVLIVNNLVN